MEEITLRHQQLQQALITLQSMIGQLQSDDGQDSIRTIAYRDSVIKRFEYTYYSQKLTDVEENILLLQMIADRNLAVHSYDETLVDEMIPRIYEYETLFNKLLNRTTP